MISWRKLMLAALLALCVGVQLLEASGHWDRNFRDANDEAGIVVVVLCVGIAVTVARRIAARIRPAHEPIAAVAVSITPFAARSAARILIPCDSPPLTLRI